jgi:hypothetical protein
MRWDFQRKIDGRWHRVAVVSGRTEARARANARRRFPMIPLGRGARFVPRLPKIQPMGE